MANRKSSFAIGEHYHIYNRGVDKRIIFTDAYDINRFFKSMIEFNIVDPIGSLYENSFQQLGGETPKSLHRDWAVLGAGDADTNGARYRCSG